VFDEFDKGKKGWEGDDWGKVHQSERESPQSLKKLSEFRDAYRAAEQIYYPAARGSLPSVGLLSTRYASLP
jgi:hypothetical protein